MMVKILGADILYLDADRNYCNLITKKNAYVLTIILKNMEEKLPSPNFIRIHRSYIAYIAQIDGVTDT